MRSNFLAIIFQIVLRTVVATATVAFFSTTSALEPVSFPLEGSVVAFVVNKGTEEVSITVSELEVLGLHRVVTVSPWERGELTFEGVLFADVVEYLGLADANALRIQALDDYSQVVPREDWVDKPLVLATRQNGKPLARRTQGPSRLVYPLAEYPNYDPAVHDARWIWLIKSIERAD